MPDAHPQAPKADPATHPPLGSLNETLPDDLPEDPFPTFVRWFDEARAAARTPNTHAMTLATVDPQGWPAARIVLCRRIDPQAGFIQFFTNYRGGKGRELEATPRAATVFHWDHADRQVRLVGPVVRCSPAESDAYFRSRHWSKRLGAWASDQSEPIGSRDDLIAKVDEVAQRLGLDLLALMRIDEGGPDVEIPRPPHWGGFHLHAHRVELWCGSAQRIHDRAVWTRTLTPEPGGFVGGAWTSTRLQP